jgi:hypothetical protein
VNDEVAILSKSLPILRGQHELQEERLDESKQSIFIAPFSIEATIVSNVQSRPFPVGFESRLILDNVEKNDRIVYLNSCACLPLYQQLAGIVGEENIKTTTGLHETIRVQDGWASLIIGQCVLDEFRNMSTALSEISRVLETGGTAMLSGPVSRTRTLRFERQGKPPIEFLSMREIERGLIQHGLRLLETHNLTTEIKTELRHSSRASSVLDFDSSMDYVLVKLVSMIDSGCE